MKVVITGAESSGKTTLFNSLEDFYNIKGAKEYAREYLSCLLYTSDAADD